MRDAAALLAYRGLTGLLEPAAGLLLRRRQARGKEDGARIGERLGFAGMTRPDGALAWVHGASVGESLSVLALVEGLVARGFRVLVTTGTVTSSRVLAGRLPPGALHQFVPIDGPAAVRRFLDHWRPDLACFAESELWPNLVGEVRRRRVPAVLVNARMSARSFTRWRRMRTVIASLLGAFDLVLAQSESDAERLRALGARDVRCAGNLKFDAAPPPAYPDELAAFRVVAGARPIWVAASTHAGEDLDGLAVHRQLTARWPALLTIIVPRKADRGPILADAAQRMGLATQLRSRERPLDPATAVYVADTMGDIGLFYRLSAPVFVGKSLVPGGGGQNPIEPAKLGCAVLHGPHVANFGAVYAALDEGGGGIAVRDVDTLAAALAALLGDRRQLDEAARAAEAAVGRLAGATARTLAAIDALVATARGRAPA